MVNDRSGVNIETDNRDPNQTDILGGLIQIDPVALFKNMLENANVDKMTVNGPIVTFYDDHNEEICFVNIEKLD